MVIQILGFALGVMQILAFLDTNMLVFPTQNGFALQWNIGIIFIHCQLCFLHMPHLTPTDEEKVKLEKLFTFFNYGFFFTNIIVS